MLRVADRAADRAEQPTPQELRTVMRRFATGVTVVTTAGHDGPSGMTANAVTSVSLDPPLVLVCVQAGSGTAERIRAGGTFAVSILAADQQAVAERFADPSRRAGDAQFRGIATALGTTGLPLVVGALGWIECLVHAVHGGGDHLIVVGRVVAVAARPGGDALLFHDGRFGAPDATDTAVL